MTREEFNAHLERLRSDGAFSVRTPYKTSNAANNDSAISSGASTASMSPSGFTATLSPLNRSWRDLQSGRTLASGESPNAVASKAQARQQVRAAQAALEQVMLSQRQQQQLEQQKQQETRQGELQRQLVQQQELLQRLQDQLEEQRELQLQQQRQQDAQQQAQLQQLQAQLQEQRQQQEEREKEIRQQQEKQELEQLQLLERLEKQQEQLKLHSRREQQEALEGDERMQAYPPRQVEEPEEQGNEPEQKQEQEQEPSHQLLATQNHPDVAKLGHFTTAVWGTSNPDRLPQRTPAAQRAQSHRAGARVACSVLSSRRRMTLRRALEVWRITVRAQKW